MDVLEEEKLQRWFFIKREDKTLNLNDIGIFSHYPVCLDNTHGNTGLFHH
jgi:hypothetical protein